MAKIRNKKLSGDGSVTFYEDKHIYNHKSKGKLTSVTQKLGEFFSKFDANAMAKYKALKSRRAGIKGQGVRYWKRLWISRSEHGTRVHAMLEEYSNLFFSHSKPKTEPETVEDMDKYLSGVGFLTTYYKSVGEPLPLTEQIIYDTDYLLAGQVDLLVERNVDGPNNKRVVDIIDFKTNNDITTEGYKGKKAKKPINHLQDCSYIKYTLQLSTYAYMLEKQGYIIGDLMLVHLKDGGEMAQVMYIPYLKKEVIDILNYNTKKEE